MNKDWDALKEAT